MKKFWNLMLVALVVMLGATACTETDERVDAKQEAGLSFYATFGSEDTRAYIDDADGDKTWTTIWEEGDTLVVTNTADNSSYKFVCTDAATGKFTCEDSAAATLVGKTVGISSDDDTHPLDSRLGKKALYVWTTGVEFTQDATIQLTSQTSFFRYTYEGEGDVTLKLEQKTSQGDDVYAFRDNKQFTNEITFSGIKGENFVPFWCGVDSSVIERDATLSYSIDGVKVKQTTIKNIGWGKVYNLGTLTDPEPAAKIYLVPNDGWKADGAWFSAHFFNSTDGFADVKLTDEDGDGTYECSVPADMEKVLFCRMNPAFTEFAWNEEGATDENLHVWNQTSDEVIGVEPDNYYYILDWAKGVWGNKDGYVAPEEPTLSWVLTGSYCSWSETGNAMTETATANLFVVEDVELATGTEIKVKASHTWDISYGGGITNLNANSWMKAYSNGSNIIVAKSGTYDVYFEYAEDAEYSKLYLVEADGDYTNAGEQTENGVLIPDEEETPGDETTEPGLTTEWALVGAFSGWADQPFVTTTNANVIVKSNVSMDAAQGFLVRKPSTEWNDKYGAGSVNYIKTNHYITTAKGGADMCLETAGTYDIYFNVSTKDIYVMAAGTDYTTATMQTVNGEEPKQEEPEVTANMLYLKPNANWKKDNARFAAYFFGNGEKWVSMVDSDSDGIYEVNIPEGYDYGCSVIFCRMNPNTTANNWNNKWNQTSDLKAPTDGKNLYTVKENTWDKGGGTWSVK